MARSGAGGPRSGPRPSEKDPVKLLISIAVALAVGVAVLLGAVAFLAFSESPSQGDGKAVQLEIPQGASTAAMAKRLAAAGVIEHPTLFRIRARLTGADGKLRAGVYDLRTGMDSGTVLDQLRQGPSVRYVSVTIPEGYTVDRIATRLEEQAGIPAKDFKALAKGGAKEFSAAHPYLADTYKGSLEGYLFPKTYRIRVGSSANDVIEMMLDQFDAEMSSVDTAAIAPRKLTTAELVTLASMIEKEAKLDSERPLVAAVIYNRLDRGMLLKIDATIQYVLGNNKFRLDGRDLRLKTPYNTYTHRGLPPGPISNPGLKSLQAAAAPADSPFLYYVLTGKDGSHTFTTNLADFLVAKKKSKEVFGK